MGCVTSPSHALQGPRPLCAEKFKLIAVLKSNWKVRKDLIGRFLTPIDLIFFQKTKPSETRSSLVIWAKTVKFIPILKLINLRLNFLQDRKTRLLIFKKISVHKSSYEFKMFHREKNKLIFLVTSSHLDKIVVDFLIQFLPFQVIVDDVQPESKIIKTKYNRY